MQPSSFGLEAHARTCHLPLAVNWCCARLGLGYRIKHVELDADGPSRISTEYTGQVPNVNLPIFQGRYVDPANGWHQSMSIGTANIGG
jgi:hypothetical protein